MDDIDYVMCTHLHVDHVGWNTRLIDGRWVPTFPNARYVFGSQEHAFWEAETAATDTRFISTACFPIVGLGRAELVANDFQLGDHMRLLPTPGHTIGHSAFRFGKKDDDAVFSGDLMHLQLQARYTELSFVRDYDKDMSAKTRRSFLERYCDTKTLCCTAHFPSPSVGRIVRWGDGFKCEAV